MLKTQDNLSPKTLNFCPPPLFAPLLTKVAPKGVIHPPLENSGLEAQVTSTLYYFYTRDINNTGMIKMFQYLAVHCR